MGMCVSSKAVACAFALMLVSGAAHAQANGKSIFEKKGLCYSCHGKDGKGTPLAPNLTDSVWINIDGSLASIIALVEKGVPKPAKHPAPMPPMGGVKLSRQEIEAVAAYVKELGKPPGSVSPATLSRRVPAREPASRASPRSSR